MNAKYTVVLKTLLDNEDSNAHINKALSTYPIYKKQSKEEYIPSYVPTREELNRKILNAYKYREIGFETPGRFYDELEIAMCEIMPRYNLLLFSADQDFNIIYNVDYQRTIDTQRDGKNSTTTQGNDSRKDIENMESQSQNQAENHTQSHDESQTQADVLNTDKKIHSTTPQDDLKITSKNIDNVTYADDVEWNKSEGQNKGTSEGDSHSESHSESSGKSESHSEKNSEGSQNIKSDGTNESKETTLETTKGNFGVVSAQDLVLKYRETILNIEQMIINDERLSELFMRVF